MKVRAGEKSSSRKNPYVCSTQIGLEWAQIVVCPGESHPSKTGPLFVDSQGLVVPPRNTHPNGALPHHRNDDGNAEVSASVCRPKRDRQNRGDKIDSAPTMIAKMF